MKPTTPIWFIKEYINRIRDKLIPFRKTEIDGLIFYYERSNPPHNPHVMGEHHEMHQRISVQKGNTAIDVGANIGSYTLRLAKRFGQVVAFEPNPFNLRILRLNVNENKLKNIRIEGVALSDQIGDRSLFIQSHAGGTSSLDSAHYGLDYDRVSRVRVMRLDDFEILGVDLIKIDVEGAELQVLKGAESTIERSNPSLGVEVHCSTRLSDEGCECDICRYLRSLDYKLELLGEYAPTPTHWVWAVRSNPHALSANVS
jgi:FkbM family methyltransferase